MKPVRPLRWAGRVVVTLTVAAVIILIGGQFAHIIARNLDAGQTLASARADVAALRAKRAAQERTIRRLEDPAGAIPEIHDKLHVVTDHETIIYVQQK